MDFYTAFFLFLTFIVVLTIWKGIKIVPQQEAWIIEKLGKFDRKLEPGLNILIPYVERLAYKHTLKEAALDVHEQTAITRDNVTLVLDGVIYMRIVDPVAASYGVTDPYYALTQLAQTTMRSEIGKLTMDESFEERERLNANIVNAINHAAQTWGIQCMRYEIKNINPPTTVLKAMELQVAAERQKRAEILDSEGKRQSQINIAEGFKQETILKAEGQQRQVLLNAEARKQEIVLQSEAAQIDQINRARGEAEAIVAVATASAESIQRIAAAIQSPGGQDAIHMRVAEQYVDAFKQLAKNTNTVLLPANANDVGSAVAQGFTILDAIRQKKA